MRGTMRNRGTVSNNREERKKKREFWLRGKIGTRQHLRFENQEGDGVRSTGAVEIALCDDIHSTAATQLTHT
jgi:hypothetical protein